MEVPVLSLIGSTALVDGVAVSSEVQRKKMNRDPGIAYDRSRSAEGTVKASCLARAVGSGDGHESAGTIPDTSAFAML